MQGAQAHAVAVADVVGRPAFVMDHLTDLERQALGHQAGEHLLPLPGPFPGVEGGHDSEGDDGRGGHVIDRDGVQDRLVEPTLGLHHAALGLQQRVEAGAFGARAGLAIGVDRAGDDPRIDRLQDLVADPQPLTHPEPVIVQHHIGFAHQVEEHLPGRRLLQVDAQPPLAAAIGQEAAAIAAEGVALGRLDLDHLGAQIGQDAAGMGASDHRAQVQHLNAGQRGCAVMPVGRGVGGPHGPGRWRVDRLRQPPHLTRRGGEFHRHIGDRDRAEVRMDEGLAQPSLRHRLAGEPGFTRPHRGAGHAGGLEHQQPVRPRPGPEDRLQGVPGEERVGQEVLQPVGIAQGRDGQPVEVDEQGPQEQPFAVAAPIEPIARRGAQGRAPRQGRLLQHPHRAGDLRQAVQAAHHHALAQAAAAALQEGGADRAGARHALAIPGQRQHQMDRLIGIGALAERHPGERRQQAVVRRQPTPEAGGPIGRHPGVDQPGMGGGEARRVETQGLEPARRRVEQGHVGLGDQVAGRGQVGGRSEVQGQDLLVAVPGLVAGMVLQPVAAGGLDLDHLGPEIPQQHGRHGPGDPLAEVQDAQARIGRHGQSSRTARSSTSRPAPSNPRPWAVYKLGHTED